MWHICHPDRLGEAELGQGWVAGESSFASHLHSFSENATAEQKEGGDEETTGQSRRPRVSLSRRILDLGYRRKTHSKRRQAAQMS